MCFPLTVYGAPSEAELVVAKDSFEQLSQHVATAAYKRAALERRLEKADATVSAAKKSLEQVVESKRFVNERILERRQLLSALSGQVLVVRSNREFYEQLTRSERQTFVEFVRFVAAKDITMTDTGPVAGGILLQQLFRGSLGDATQEHLVISAVLKTRMQVLRQLETLLEDSSGAEERLHAVAEDLGQELSDFEKQQQLLGEVATKQQTAIDVNWKQQQLTEQELAAVVRESDESAARLLEIQTKLRSISDELKQGELTALRSERSLLEAKKRPLQDALEELKRKDTAMHIIEDAALKALQETVRLRNTDTKLYKKTEFRELQLKNAKERLLALETEGGTGSSLSSDGTALRREIDTQQQIVALMQSGVPEDPAVAYVRAKHDAAQATLERGAIALKIAGLAKQIAVLTTQISDVIGKIEGVENGTDGLPSLFQWPVNGPISAGYLDPAYELVFRIPHRAIDIAVRQGTAVRAVSDGIVYAVKDGGATGYSYILIGHQNGFASLYGHIFQAYVTPGQKVTGGATIGLSGGIPGTRGAGYMTTGAHLHLEMTKDGKHFDPRTVLPKK